MIGQKWIENVVRSNKDLLIRSFSSDWFPMARKNCIFICREPTKKCNEIIMKSLLNFVENASIENVKQVEQIERQHFELSRLCQKLILFDTTTSRVTSSSDATENPIDLNESNQKWKKKKNQSKTNSTKLNFHFGFVSNWRAEYSCLRPQQTKLDDNLRFG